MNNQWWRSPWQWAIVFGLACMTLAYGVYWEHGPHHDDYFLYSYSFQQLVDLMRDEVRPVGKLIGAIIFSQPKVVARLFGAAMIIGTSLLGGLLLYRLFRIRLAALSVILLCLVPFSGTEATTWTNAMIHFVPAGFFALIALNFFSLALREVEQPHRMRWLALLSGIALVLAFGSIEPAANFYILFLGLLLAERHQHSENTRHMLKALAWSTIVIVILGAIIYLIFYINTSQVTRRGTFEVPSLERIGRFLIGFHQRGLGGSFGQEFIRISFKEGWEAVLTNRIATFLECGTIATAVALNLSWKTETIQAKQKEYLIFRSNIMMAACLLTAIASMMLPAVLLSDEPGSPRLAYLPGISGALFFGCCISRVMVMRNSFVRQRIILALITISVLVFSVHLLGYTRMYYLRYAYDQLQVKALIKAVPPESIANKNIIYLPFEVYENFLGYPTNTNPNFMLIGGFSSPNSVGTILKQAYPQTRITVIRPGYGNFNWGIELKKGHSLVLSGYAGDPPQEVIPDDLILFRYCENGIVELAETIQFSDENGIIIDTVQLPWATQLRMDNGTRTFVVQRSSS